MGRVEDYILYELEHKGALFFALIDPIDYNTTDDAIMAGKLAAENGADIILIGGSIGAQGSLLDTVTKEIRENINVPIVLFPGNIATITSHADAIYFMSLLNSRNPYWISQAQTLAAPVIRSLGIEPLSVGYIVVEPGGSVGWVGDANLIPRHKPKIATALALAAQFSGNRLLLTDAGSNPPTGHIPVEMISMISKTVDIPYIVGGGIRTVNDAKNVITAGADIIQVGTLFEKKSSTAFIKDMIDTVHEIGKSRI